MKHFKGFPRIATVVGVGFALCALLWWALAIPALVKYPTDASATPRYAGTFTVYVDQATMAPLAQPQTLPLTIERRIQAIDEQSGSSKVLVDETITQNAGPMNTTQHNVYVMDRSTLKNVADGRAVCVRPGERRRPFGLVPAQPAVRNERVLDLSRLQERDRHDLRHAR